MAGLWELIRPNAEKRLSQHFLGAGIVLYASGDFARGEVLSAFESRYQGRYGVSLDEASAGTTADLGAIADQVDALVGATEKLVYAHMAEAAGIAAENGSIGEAKWRSILGI